jgi:Leucine-rich repeat (LRR) protein
MEDNRTKIKALVATADLVNIELAFELAKGQDLDINELLKGYRILLKMSADELLTPSKIADARYLLMLDLSKLGLNKLPEEISYFKELNSIDLSDNQLYNLPATMAAMSKLQAIKLNNNRFAQVPPILYTLKELRQLYLNYNPILNLSPQLASLKQLSQLGLRGCGLKEFSEFLCPEGSPYFTLDLGENKLESLPPAFGNFKNMHYLHLDGNLLKSLPQEINNFRFLQELDISRNFFLEELPRNLTNLKSLANLYMSQTPINNIRFIERDIPWTEFWV